MSIRIKTLRCREIITKAVCGKGRKFSQVTHTVTPPHRPSSILGAWLINHQYEAVKSGDGIEVVGTYDINIWYSYDKNTKTDVAKETISYVGNRTAVLSGSETPHFHGRGNGGSDAGTKLCGSQRVIRTVNSDHPRGTGIQAEMIAETKVCVVVCEGGCDDSVIRH